MTQNRIKTVLTLAAVATAVVVLATTSVNAGTISYVPISGDADSDISTDKTYTHAIDFGNQPAGGGVATVNGVIFANGGSGDFPAIGGSSQTVGTGSSTIPQSHNGDSAADAYLADGGMRDLVHDMIYNNATAVIQLTGLTPGSPYRLRVYHRSWGGTRPQDIGFDTDGVGTDITGAEDTAVFFEDDATQPDPSFATATQVYALTYDYTLSSGVTTLTVYINNTGTGTYHLYGLTNEEADPMNPSPYNGETVLPANPLELRWTNLDPNTVPRTPVFVDVWFGTDPEALALVVDADVDGQDANSVAVDASALGVYYWRVDSYLGGSPTGDPNIGNLWTFSTDFPPTSVEILTPDMITWSDRGVDLEGTFVDDSDPLDWTIAWTSDPDAGVSFTDATALDPTVTITSPTLHRVVREIQVENDDVEEYLNTVAVHGWGDYPQGDLDLGDSDLEVGDDGGDGEFWQVCAVQYDQLGIPQGATIISAKLTFQVDEAGDPYTSNDFTILAEAADDASVFSGSGDYGTPFDVTSRARSTASVPWDPNTAIPVGEKVDTPDITELIQEVVDRPGWSANNRLTLMIYPDVYLALPDPATGGYTLVSSHTYEAGPGTDSATLTVEYESTDSFDPVTVTLTLGVNDVINPEVVTDTMTIDVYDNACRAAIGAGEVVPADFDENCIVNLADLAMLLEDWLTCTTPNVTGCIPDYRP